MDILRTILIGLGLVGLLLIGSCTMLGYGAVSLVGKAAEVAIAKQNSPEMQAARRARAEAYSDELAERLDEQSSYSQSYGERAYQNTSDATEPSLDLEE